MRHGFGAHVDQADPVAEASARGADVVQFFLGDPQSWKAPSVAYAGGASALREAAAAAGIGLYIHAPYVLNVATTNNRIRIPSRKLLQQTARLASEVGALGVIVHGGHVNAGDDPQTGYDNWRKAIDGLDSDVPVLIENTAGGTRSMTRHIDSIARLWEAISTASGFDNVGFCLDTCHAHAGGNALSGVVDAVRAVTGRVDLVHLNDSRDGFDSGADRHANLGRGQADPDGLVDVVVAADAPVILETPGGASEQREDLAWLRERVASR